MKRTRGDRYGVDSLSMHVSWIVVLLDQTLNLSEIILDLAKFKSPS